jgi:hypothetical protein
MGNWLPIMLKFNDGCANADPSYVWSACLAPWMGNWLPITIP